jgi:hypothetical protein
MEWGIAVPKKIILVSGVGNSGKTSSIRKYLNLEGVFHLRRRGDITLVFPLRRKKIILGVASGGDNVAIVTRNFQFFAQHRCDVIVCASKGRGGTVAYVQNAARRSGARLIHLRTSKVPAARRQQANATLARRIYGAV